MNDLNENEEHAAPEAGGESSARNESEIERLRQRVRELQQQLAAVQAERDLWHKEALAWAMREMDRTDPLTPERVEQMIHEEEWLPSETIWEEIKPILEGR